MDSVKRTILGLSIALILLLIFCSWYKADMITLAQAEKSKQAQTLATNQSNQPKKATEETSYILFDVIKKGDKVVVGGKFYDEAQMRSFGKNFEQGSEIKYISNDFNKSRRANDALSLAHAVAPIFNNHFVDGSIRYHGKKVVIDGTIKDKESKATLAKLLEERGVPYIDNSKVLEKKKDTYLNIVKSADNRYQLDANLSSNEQKDKILGMFKSANLTPTENCNIDENLQKEEWTVAILEIFPVVADEFDEGRVYYIDGKIGVEGKTSSKEAKTKIEKALKASNIPYFVKVEEVEVPKTQVAESSTPAENGASSQDSNATNEAQEDKQVETTKTETDALPADAHNYEEIYKQMTPEQREMSKKIEDNISALLKVENITFATGSSKLTKKGKKTVDKIANVLKAYPNVYIEIAGHTDNTGNADANLKLSQRRVDSVKAELMSLGIEEKRLTAVGYGQTRPKVANDTKEHRRQNRRVEFHIIKILEEGK